MEKALTSLVILLGIINAIRMSFYFLMSDIYDVLHHRRAKRIKSVISRPLVSVIIAAYNEEKVISQTLRSVVQSNYKNIEVIVVNDGSSDTTEQVVAGFMRTHPSEKISLINQVNSGKAHALNNGIKTLACGEFVMSLDADSVIDSHAISNALHYFTDKKIVGVAANVKIIKTPTLIGAIQYIEYLMGHKLKKAYTVLNNEYIVGGIGSMFRRSILEKVGYYDTDTITEDIDLTMKILREGNKENRVVFGSNVICYTEPVKTIQDLYRQRFRWKYGRFQTLYKNRHLFFSSSKQHSKLLTWFQLPFVLYSELTFLIDPLLIGFLIFLTTKYHELKTIGGAFLFVGFYTLMTVIGDEHLTTTEKIVNIFLSPFAYLFFLTISFVEYAALIQSIFRPGGIINAKQLNRCGWTHVERHGISGASV